MAGAQMSCGSRASRTSRRLPLGGGVLVCAAIWASFGVASAAARGRSVPAPPQRPNVLLIMVDDLKPAIRSFGDTQAITPNIDRLAARGTRFELAYANQAVCAPSRINLMTGARSTSTGIYDFGRNFRDIMPAAVTLPQYFMQAGYVAESLGKTYHIGHNTNGDRASWSRAPYKDHVIEYVSPAGKASGRTREAALFNEFELPPGDVWSYARTLGRGLAWEAPDVADDAYADGRVAARAVRRLAAFARNRRPFFLAVGFARPHLPFSVPRRYWDLYDPARFALPTFEQPPVGAPAYAGKIGGEINAYQPIDEKTPAARYPEALKRTLIHGYYAGVSFADAQIGKLIAELDRSGLTRNTIVVLWGDHGFHLGDHGIWTKHTNYEQAVHLPLLFAGPGITANQATRQLAETVDIYPTLAHLAGLPPPAGPQPIDGIDMTPVLRDGAMRLRSYAYHAYPRPGRIGQAIRTERYRLVRWTQDATNARDYELYDMAGDPGETRNIAREQPAVRAGLEALLDAEPAPRPVAPPSAIARAPDKGRPQTDASRR